MARPRFEYTLLDPEDPFEIDDGNKPHLYKHLPTNSRGKLIPVGVEDILDGYLYDAPRFYEADRGGDADWLMLAEIPGGLIICVPLAPPGYHDHKRCRPIGLYNAVTELRNRYLSEIGWTT